MSPVISSGFSEILHLGFLGWLKHVETLLKPNHGVDQLSGAGIKQLKHFLHRRGVRMPQSIAEKGDLVALVEESKVAGGLGHALEWGNHGVLEMGKSIDSLENFGLFVLSLEMWISIQRNMTFVQQACGLSGSQSCRSHQSCDVK